MKNHVEFLGWYGGDRGIARAAWTSTQVDVNTKTDEQIRELLVNTLWNNGSGKPHKTPFERGLVEFNITLEQASHIHALKHRLANINGESARYKELKENKLYIPEDWKGQAVSEEFMEYIMEMYKIHLYGTWDKDLELMSELTNTMYHQAIKELSPALGRKRAKESARYFKMMNSQITLSVMMNMSCFQNFYTLRADEAAQKEIQWIAEDMLSCIKNIDGNPFKYTLEAFGF